MITYNADGISMPKFKRRIANKWIRAVAAGHGRKVGEVGYMFVDDEKILEVNNQYLGHDYYTDIITFHKSYEDEFHRVLIHGVLHLCGINDKGPGERAVMERNEDEALALLRRIQDAASLDEKK